MSKERERYNQIMQLVMTADEIFFSEEIDKFITFYLNEFGVKVSVFENVYNREKSFSTHYYTNELSVPKTIKGYIYDPRLDAAEAKIRELVEKVIEEIGRNGEQS